MNKRDKGRHRPRLSLCMIALNEEQLIRDALHSVAGVVDEIVLGLDSRTDDGTAAIARGYGARVLPFEWRDDFSYARNLTLEAARGEWILILDADDRLLPAGARAIRPVVNCAVDLNAPDGGPPLTGFQLEIAETRLDGQVTRTHTTSVRLFRRRAGVRYVGAVHENVHYLPNPDRTSCAPFDGGPHITHLGYDPALMQERQKPERNRRLLELRVAQDPEDIEARWYLARQLRDANPERSILHARLALERPDKLRPEQRTQLEQLVADSGSGLETGV